MPKAAVDEQRDRPPREDEIGCTRKIAPVEAMSKAQRVRGLPDPQLGRGVFGTHPRHVPWALRWRNGLRGRRTWSRSHL